MTEFIQSNTILLYTVIGVAGVIVLGYLLDLVIIAARKMRNKKTGKENCEVGVLANENASPNHDVKQHQRKMVAVRESDLLAIKRELKLVQRRVFETLQQEGLVKEEKKTIKTRKESKRKLIPN